MEPQISETKRDARSGSPFDGTIVLMELFSLQHTSCAISDEKRHPDLDSPLFFWQVFQFATKRRDVGRGFLYVNALGWGFFICFFCLDVVVCCITTVTDSRDPFSFADDAVFHPLMFYFPFILSPWAVRRGEKGGGNISCHSTARFHDFVKSLTCGFGYVCSS